MECQKEKNKVNCNCTYDCELNGFCCECIKDHREKGELPACYFSERLEKNHDRSVGNFIKNYNAKKDSGNNQ